MSLALSSLLPRALYTSFGGSQTTWGGPAAVVEEGPPPSGAVFKYGKGKEERDLWFRGQLRGGAEALQLNAVLLLLLV